MDDSQTLTLMPADMADLRQKLLTVSDMGEFKSYAEEKDYASRMRDIVHPITQQTLIFYACNITDDTKAHRAVECLKQMGVSPVQLDHLSQTALFYASRNGLASVVEWLVKAGNAVNHMDNISQSALFYATSKAQLGCMQRLLDLEANPNCIDSNGQTPLFYAANCNSLDACKILINHGARADYKDKSKPKRCTAQQWARDRRFHEVADYLSGYEKSNKRSSMDSLGDLERKLERKPKEAREKKPKLSVGQKRQRESIGGEPIKPSLIRQGRKKCMFVLQESPEMSVQVHTELLKQLEKLFPHLTRYDHKVEPTAMWVKRARDLIVDVVKHPDSVWFRRPVDPLKDFCPDYLRIITAPMDFGTIRRNLEQGVYKKMVQFVSDCDLVFKNCQTYNKPGSPVGDMGARLQEYLKRKYEELDLAVFLRQEMLMDQACGRMDMCPQYPFGAPPGFPVNGNQVPITAKINSVITIPSPTMRQAIEQAKADGKPIPEQYLQHAHLFKATADMAAGLAPPVGGPLPIPPVVSSAPAAGVRWTAPGTAPVARAEGQQNPASTPRESGALPAAAVLPPPSPEKPMPSPVNAINVIPAGPTPAMQPTDATLPQIPAPESSDASEANSAMPFDAGDLSSSAPETSNAEETSDGSAAGFEAGPDQDDEQPLFPKGFGDDDDDEDEESDDEDEDAASRARGDDDFLGGDDDDEDEEEEEAEEGDDPFGDDLDDNANVAQFDSMAMSSAHTPSNEPTDEVDDYLSG